ncbi:hypothetical protein [Verminephrobacter eiseniae]|uniref:hypothetical protein n=1 Tax=Verminephrobacter eiseniae TaxID=364317 RepID=UPI0002E18E50|nr:hypothetical protein [Verminephrobacter eiseniae]MCW5284308.1 hypothetical protein [Verminephrobacter eiseniae]MCW5302015.1 hypothetical protein [Verminephrobacter eiseniae]MCW8178777.1 hypothetical protein [Verminephrobacter eiseniae]MCW8191112.1 hypothetical protein [Verminephrobacter eiseniae]
MPLSHTVPPLAAYPPGAPHQGHERSDGLWGIEGEGELHGSKTCDAPVLRHATGSAGSVSSAGSARDDGQQPPRRLGQCIGRDFDGSGVKEFFPPFYGRGSAGTAPAAAQRPAALAAGKTG